MISQSYDGDLVMYKKKLLVFIVLFYSGFVWAELPGVMQWDVEHDSNRIYREIYRALEDHQFFVIFEANIGRNLRGYQPVEQPGSRYVVALSAPHHGR
jgi:hypothetical protein